MRTTKMLARALRVEGALIKEVREEGDAIVVRVRAPARARKRCPVCCRRCPGYDAGDGDRRWRTHDVVLAHAFIEAESPRVRCPEHGVLVAHVPWARHRSGFTRSFEDTIAWLAVRTDKSTLAGLMAIAWAGAIVARVCAPGLADDSRFDGVTRIGIDELSYRKGHQYLTVVVNHDTGHLLWAHPGRNEATLRKFFRAFGAARCKRLTLVSADAAPWIANVVAERCPNATLCIDPFHVVMWVTKVLDDVRRGMWNDLRRRKDSVRAKALKSSRWSLVKNPEDLTRGQKNKLRAIEQDNKVLYRACLMKEQLREIIATKDWQVPWMFDAWLEWVLRSRIEPMKEAARAIRNHLPGIEAALRHGLSNARVESLNTRLRLLTRMAFGFHSYEPLIALAMLKVGGMCPALPSLR